MSPNVRDADGLTPLDYAQEDAGMDDGTQFANVSGAGQEIAVSVSRVGRAGLGDDGACRVCEG